MAQVVVMQELERLECWAEVCSAANAAKHREPSTGMEKSAEFLYSIFTLFSTRPPLPNLHHSPVIVPASRLGESL